MPGTGKTRWLKRFSQLLKAKGYTALTLAFTHSAAYVVGGVEAITLTRFCLSNQRGPYNASKTVLIIDEASQVPSQL